MKTVEYVLELSDGEKMRVFFVKKHGKIQKFIVQYYARIGPKWRTVMRIDTCHGIPHQHIYHLRKREYWVLLNSARDFSFLFTWAITYIKDDFQKIKENFLYSK